MTIDPDCFCPCLGCTSSLEMHCGRTAAQADQERVRLNLPLMQRGCEHGQEAAHEQEAALYYSLISPMADALGAES